MSKFIATVTATGNAVSVEQANRDASALVADLEARHGHRARFAVVTVENAPEEPRQVHSLELTAEERAEVDALIASRRGE